MWRPAIHAAMGMQQGIEWVHQHEVRDHAQCSAADLLSQSSSLTNFANAGSIGAMQSTTSTMNIALPETMRSYVAKRVDSGEYGNTSEYVRDLIRKDQREQEIRRLRALLQEGLDSGPATPMTAADWQELEDIASGKIE